MVNIYTDRHYDTDQELYEKFTEKTGISINGTHINISGAGKSTLLKMISGLEKPKSDEIYLDNKLLYGKGTIVTTELDNYILKSIREELFGIIREIGITTIMALIILRMLKLRQIELLKLCKVL